MTEEKQKQTGFRVGSGFDSVIRWLRENYPSEVQTLTEFRHWRGRTVPLTYLYWPTEIVKLCPLVEQTETGEFRKCSEKRTGEN